MIGERINNAIIKYNEEAKSAGHDILRKRDIAKKIFKDRNISISSKQQLLSNYINNKIQVPFEDAIKISKLLNVSLDFLSGENN